MKLSQTKISKLNKPGKYHDGFGLYLQVQGESRSWLFRFEKAGRDKWMGLGPLPTINIEEARERARKARQLLLDGSCPMAAAHEARTTRQRETSGLKTFREAAEAFLAQRKAEWTEKHYKDSAKRLEYAYPTLGSQPVAKINKPLVIETVQPIWTEKNATACMTLGLIEKVLDFAKASGWRSGDNPAVWSRNLQYALPAPQVSENRPALPFAEVYSFMGELKKIKSVAARALEFTILTAVRTDEARLATWSEIDLNTKRSKGQNT